MPRPGRRPVGSDRRRRPMRYRPARQCGAQRGTARVRRPPHRTGRRPAAPTRNEAGSNQSGLLLVEGCAVKSRALPPSRPMTKMPDVEPTPMPWRRLKTMLAPSGDQAGPASLSTCSVSLRRRPPSALTEYRSKPGVPPSRPRAKTRRRPSGDQRGVRLHASSRVIWRASPPPGSTAKISESDPRVVTKAISDPSGDHDGA